MTHIQQELQYRQRQWESLLAQGGSMNVAPQILRDLGIYGSAQGIWVDKSRTGALLENGYGVTVSLSLSGNSYPDDWSEQALLYHYPLTNRPPSRDQSEIEATKNASLLGLPVFVITHPTHSKRNIYRGRVESWNDEERQFLVILDDLVPIDRRLPIVREEPEAYNPFNLFHKEVVLTNIVPGRPGQQLFKLQVLKRYGAACAVCDLGVLALLQAAHIIPKEFDGSDDARNGLILCANHHLAFDQHLFGIQPERLDLCYASASTASALQITRTDIRHLVHAPHPEALAWRFSRWHTGSTG